MLIGLGAWSVRRQNAHCKKVSEVGVKLGVTSGYARPPKVCDISFKYHPPPLVVAPTFLTRL